MKVRMDFVTNSSSSSFIFKDNGNFNISYYEKALNLCPILPIHEHKMDALEEVFVWYIEDIWKTVFEDYPKWTWDADNNKRKDDFEQLLSNLETREIVQKQWKMIAAIFVLTVLFYTDGEKDNLSSDDIVNTVWETLGTTLNRYVPNANLLLYSCIHKDPEQLLKYATEYSNVPAGIILEKLLDADYMYYSPEGSGSYITMDNEELIEELPACILGCVHMG